MAMKFSEYFEYDALGLADLVRRKEVEPKELVDVAIKHIEAVNPELNAVIHHYHDSAVALAKSDIPEGPFSGVPFLFKDLAAFEPGVPVSFGSKFCQGMMVDTESEVVSRFKGAGLVSLGRTNTPEFGLYPTTEPELFGPTRNPWNPEHIAGGSSGGAAAAVASGMVPIAHGGDGGGSIRIPASCCGLFGFKPNEGRSPVGPPGGRMWHGLAVEHVLARSVRDNAAALDVLSAPQIGAPILTLPPATPFLKQIEKPVRPLKIMMLEAPFFRADLHADCKDALHDAAKLCESLGHSVELTKLDIDLSQVAHAYLVVVAAESAAMLDLFIEHLGRKPKPSELEAVTFICCQGGKAFSAADYARAVRIMDEARYNVARFMEPYDVMLTPTLALPPPKLGMLGPTLLEKSMMALLKQMPSSALIRLAFRLIPENAFKLAPYTFLFNLTGQPAMSVPLYWNQEGLPIGSHFVGKSCEEGLLLQLARQLEEARPFNHKQAPMLAAMLGKERGVSKKQPRAPKLAESSAQAAQV